jgi:hypothetical protein
MEPTMDSTNRTPPHRTPPSPRGFVSPLGGACAPFATDLQKRQERLNRAQSPIPPELRGRNDRGQERPNDAPGRTNNRR